MMAKHARVPLVANPGESLKNKEFYHNAKTLQPVSLKFYEKLVVTGWLFFGGGGGMRPIKT